MRNIAGMQKSGLAWAFRFLPCPPKTLLPSPPQIKNPKRVLERLPPRLHRWFQSTWPDPQAWLQSRSAYTRTCGVMSMVGHVMGLGDRHGENIMLDTKSGEVVHIDFACLFDRGLTLNVPEVTPFRLTHNVIDGMGVQGTEGAFRRACEETLRVLRTHRQTFLGTAET